MNYIKNHIKDNIYAYALLTIAMVIGIIKANFDLITMNGANINELGQDINNVFYMMGNNSIQKDDMVLREFINIVKLLMIVWVCGSSIIGIPVIFYVVYTKGYMLGVCSGILIKSMGINGITLISLGILPKEIFFIPIIIILGVNGIKFSTYIIKSNKLHMFRRKSVLKEFAIYSMTWIAMCIVSLGGVGISRLAMKYVALFYKK